MSTGAHLHWGMYIFGIPVNPFNFVVNDYEAGLPPATD
jgi:murein DD-endopeptidase MepM/ murein hydrolase activator NlpD